MEPIKTLFTTADLEHISGVKAATIRMWEKRYQLFRPRKALRNIRSYDLEQLQKLLNITLLIKNGHKISKIALLSDKAITLTSQELIHGRFSNAKGLSDLKMAMYRLDQDLFEQSYLALLKKASFDSVFQEVFVPFLHFIGLLWQTNSIKPIHEHFISNLISQKIQQNTRLHPLPGQKRKTFVLFLPENEIHELGLLYLNYYIQHKGHRTVYLGRNIPLTDLNHVQEIFPHCEIVGYFTLMQPEKELVEFFASIQKNFERHGNKLLFVVPPPMESMDVTFGPQVKVFTQLKHILTYF
ncbi:MAG: MerR family transcriptional regulator [Flavobacteriaceae bacterium]